MSIIKVSCSIVHIIDIGKCGGNVKGKKKITDMTDIYKRQHMKIVIIKCYMADNEKYNIDLMTEVRTTLSKRNQNPK